jgi:hypothetical protein
MLPVRRSVHTPWVIYFASRFQWLAFPDPNRPATARPLLQLCHKPGGRSAEELLESVKDQQGAVAAQLREKLSGTVDKTRDRLEEFDAREAASEPLIPRWGSSAMTRGAPWLLAPWLF